MEGQLSLRMLVDLSSGNIRRHINSGGELVANRALPEK